MALGQGHVGVLTLCILPLMAAVAPNHCHVPWTHPKPKHRVTNALWQWKGHPCVLGGGWGGKRGGYTASANPECAPNPMEPHCGAFQTSTLLSTMLMDNEMLHMLCSGFGLHLTSAQEHDGSLV